MTCLLLHFLSRLCFSQQGGREEASAGRPLPVSAGISAPGLHQGFRSCNVSVPPTGVSERSSGSSGSSSRGGMCGRKTVALSSFLACCTFWRFLH